MAGISSWVGLRKRGKSLRIISVKNKQKQPTVVLQEKMFLEISQNSQENTCVRVSFLIKLQNTFFTEHVLVTAS